MILSDLRKWIGRIGRELKNSWQKKHVEQQHFYKFYMLQQLFKGFPEVFKKGCADIFRNMHFLCDTKYIQKQSIGGILKVLGDI